MAILTIDLLKSLQQSSDEEREYYQHDICFVQDVQIRGLSNASRDERIKLYSAYFKMAAAACEDSRKYFVLGEVSPDILEDMHEAAQQVLPQDFSLFYIGSNPSYQEKFTSFDRDNLALTTQQELCDLVRAPTATSDETITSLCTRLAGDNIETNEASLRFLMIVLHIFLEKNISPNILFKIFKNQKEDRVFMEARIFSGPETFLLLLATILDHLKKLNLVTIENVYCCMHLQLNFLSSMLEWLEDKNALHLFNQEMLGYCMIFDVYQPDTGLGILQWLIASLDLPAHPENIRFISDLVHHDNFYNALFIATRLTTYIDKPWTTQSIKDFIDKLDFYDETFTDDIEHIVDKSAEFDIDVTEEDFFAFYDNKAQIKELAKVLEVFYGKLRSQHQENHADNNENDWEIDIGASLPIRKMIYANVAHTKRILICFNSLEKLKILNLDTMQLVLKHAEDAEYIADACKNHASDEIVEKTSSDPQTQQYESTIYADIRAILNYLPEDQRATALENSERYNHKRCKQYQLLSDLFPPPTVIANIIAQYANFMPVTAFNSTSETSFKKRKL